MAIFPRFIESRKYAPSDDYWYYPVAFPSSAGIPVDEKTALKYLTVYACVSLISADIGRLPLNLYRRRKSGGKDLITDHQLYDLLHNAPNPEMTSFNWREAAQGHLLLWGNQYNYKERARDGTIIGLWPLPDPSQVKVYRRGDQIVYEYLKDNKPVYRTRDEIFHIPGFGFNGLVGMSMIALSREAIGLGMAAETFGSNFFSQGTHPSGILTMEQDLGDNEAEYLKRLKEMYAGLGKSHSIMVLQNNEQYKPLTMPLDDAQFLETRDHQKIEICGMYHVPPHKIAVHNQNANYNNLEQENASYVDSCLMNWVSRWESQISLQLLTEKERKSGLFVEFLVQGLLRGDAKSRAEYYNKLFQIGAITPDEIRDKENMNPVEGGDKAFVMLNLTPLADAGKEMVLPGDQIQQEKEPQILEEQKALYLEFFSEDRAQDLKEQKSIRMRDRLARSYFILIKDAARAIVTRETKAIKKHLTNPQTRAGADSMADFLDDFYKEFPEYIEQKMGPILRSYLMAVIDESTAEIGGDSINLDVEVKNYIESYAARHSSGSLGQMKALLEGDIKELDARADEWLAKRPEKIATDETVRASSAAFSWVVFAAGLSLVWRIRGAKTCPYCQSLQGKRVVSGGSFVKGGDEIDPKDGTGPMRFFGLKQHPPLHQGCDCYVSAI